MLAKWTVDKISSLLSIIITTIFGWNLMISLGQRQYLSNIFLIIKIFYGKCVIVASMPEKFLYFFFYRHFKIVADPDYILLSKKQTKGYLSFTQLSNIYLIVSKFTWNFIFVKLCIKTNVPLIILL